MNLIGSIIRRLSFIVGNSEGNTRQDVRDSSGVVQAGRDVTVHQYGEPEKSYPKIGEAFFPDLDLALDVHDFRAGEDRSDSRYVATLRTAHVARFVVALRQADYVTFRIKENQGMVDLPCVVTVPEGSYKGNVTYIEMGQRESSYLGLLCWFNVPVDTKI